MRKARRRACAGYGRWWRSMAVLLALHRSWQPLLRDAGSGRVSKTVLTQFGRALTQLGIEHIAAYSPQARGRSERVFGTLQDRLPKEFALAGPPSVVLGAASTGRLRRQRLGHLAGTTGRMTRFQRSRSVRGHAPAQSKNEADRSCYQNWTDWLASNRWDRLKGNGELNNR
jgi:hypothetical protein